MAAGLMRALGFTPIVPPPQPAPGSFTPFTDVLATDEHVVGLVTATVRDDDDEFS
jgi:hypothetical protein